MTREDIALSERQRETLDRALDANDALQIVFDFKEQLRSLLEPSLKDSARLARLRAWCRNAEASGIDALREFAAQLRGYHMQAA